MAAKRRKGKTRQEATAPADGTLPSTEVSAHVRTKTPPQRRGSIARRLAYWSLVLGIWAFIAVIGVLGLAILNLPPIDTLEIPKRPPSIEIVGLDGRPLATRGEMHGAMATTGEVPPYLPRALLPTEQR